MTLQQDHLNKTTFKSNSSGNHQDSNCETSSFTSSTQLQFVASQRFKPFYSALHRSESVYNCLVSRTFILLHDLSNFCYEMEHYPNAEISPLVSSSIITCDNSGTIMFMTNKSLRDLPQIILQNWDLKAADLTRNHYQNKPLSVNKEQ